MDTPSSSSGPQAQPRPPPPEPVAQAPATDPQWRTACRTCGASFKSRNQLMRHLYRSHPGKPGRQGKPKAPSQSTPRSAQTAQAPAPTPAPTSREPGQQQQLAFAAQVLSAIFTVGMQQQQQEGQEGNHQPAGLQPNPAHSLPPSQLSRTLGEASASGPKSSTVHPSSHAPTTTTTTVNGATTAAAAAAAQDQTWTRQGGEADTKALDDSESEDSDDDDDGGGVALFGPPALGELSFRPGDDAEVGRDVEELDAVGDLD
ncbi:hypothetical protein NEMBOFW57_008194 [Staphylotrichum longicolle]|uniref:C2H2-type domain-containing protein n=1 Tax=Staphylotrichum longicolle TaxID=669026 RepID=A0AAD4HWY4_9PEZI|nr:hypothetical protein NEMBOFW57_008194 [Staphylotrichum longicolle]